MRCLFLVVLTLLVASCVPEDASVGDIPANVIQPMVIEAPTFEGQSPPPMGMVLSPLEAGMTVDIGVNNANPGDAVYLVWGTSLGNPLCPPQLGGVCVEVGGPSLGGMAQANAAGIAIISFTVPPAPAGTPLYFQPVVVAGPQSYTGPVTQGVVTAGPPVCVLDEYNMAAAAPVGQMADPLYFGFQFYGIVENSQLYDYDTSLGNFNASMVFTFYDAAILPVCSVWYDISSSTPINPTLWNTTSGQNLYHAWLVDLANGSTDCAMVNPQTFGTTDLRQWVEGTQWGIALGDLIDQKADLEAAVIGAGLDWAADWEPYLYAGFIWSGMDAIEVSYAFNYTRSCQMVDENAQGEWFQTEPTTVINGGDDMAAAYPFYVFAI